MTTTVVIFISLLIRSIQTTKTPIIVYRITASSDTSTSDTTELIQQIAINEINENPDILPDYELQLKVLESFGDSEKALEHAIVTSQSFSQCEITNNSSLISPIVMGAPWSSFSVLTSRVFNIYHLLQISASATSPALSEKDKYGSFFRTIANDELQGKALIKLCSQFGWTRIGVIYVNDNYGLNFNKVIQEEADKEHIEVHSQSFVQNDRDSIKKAAKFLKDEKLYVTILIAQGTDTYHLFDVETFDYPYFLIGTDAWFDEGEIEAHNITNVTIGAIGTTPGNPTMFTVDEYIKNNIYNGNMTIYNISNNISQRVMSQMKKSSFPITSTIMGYAYDALYSLAYSLNIYDKNHSLKTKLMDCNQLEDVTNDLRQILIDMPEFIGLTGPVKFDENGDRVNGMFVYGFIKHDGTIQVFGDFSTKNDSRIINTTDIIFAKQFEEYEHAPRSEPLISEIRNGINLSTIAIITALYACICFMGFVLLYKRKNDKGNVVYLSMTIGLILTCILMVSYGLQKNNDTYGGYQYSGWYDGWCFSNLLIVCVAFTFTFLAFITSKSELMRIIIKFMKKQKLGKYNGDKTVSKKLRNCLIADFVIILLWITVYLCVYFVNDIKLLEYEFIYIGGEINTKDELHKIQNLYPMCNAHWSTNILYGILFLYKIIQMLYAIDGAVGIMVSYMILIVCIALIGLIATVWYILEQMLLNDQINQDTQYSILSILIIFIYLLWIIPEYYYLCRNNSKSNKEESSTTYGGTTNDTTTTTISTTQPDTTCSDKHDHVTAAEADKICKLDKNKNETIVVYNNNEYKQEEILDLVKHTNINENNTDKEDDNMLPFATTKMQTTASNSYIHHD